MDFVCWRAVCQSQWRRAGNGFAEIPLHHEVVCLFCFIPLHLADPELHARLVGEALPTRSSVRKPVSRLKPKKLPKAVRTRRFSRRSRRAG